MKLKGTMTAVLCAVVFYTALATSPARASEAYANGKETKIIVQTRDKDGKRAKKGGIIGGIVGVATGAGAGAAIGGIGVALCGTAVGIPVGMVCIGLGTALGVTGAATGAVVGNLTAPTTTEVVTVHQQEGGEQHSQANKKEHREKTGKH